jgi:hypothetical protein
MNSLTPKNSTIPIKKTLKTYYLLTNDCLSIPVNIVILPYITKYFAIN